MTQQHNDYQDLVQAERAFRSENIDSNYNKMVKNAGKRSVSGCILHSIRSIIKIPFVTVSFLREGWVWIAVCLPIIGLLYGCFYLNGQLG